MKRLQSATALVLVGLGMLLAGCEAQDKDLVIYFSKEWGKQHGLFNEDGSPTKTALARGLAKDLSNWLKPDIKDENGEVDEAGNAAVDAGVVVKGVVDNDKLADGAVLAIKKNPPDKETALKDINSALKARPNDWYYLNRRSLIYATLGQETNAGRGYNAAEDSCGGNQHCLDAVRRDRKQLFGTK